jgi:hypothetical protein
VRLCECMCGARRADGAGADIVEAEYFLMEDLKFNLLVFHAYRPMERLIKDAKDSNHGINVMVQDACKSSCYLFASTGCSQVQGPGRCGACLGSRPGQSWRVAVLADDRCLETLQKNILSAEDPSDQGTDVGEEHGSRSTRVMNTVGARVC